jgi:gamma-glutamyltranspeptidase/glutathione hydrolase
MLLRAHNPVGPVLTFLAISLIQPPATVVAQSAQQSAWSDAGMVSASHPLATEAGVRMLEAGGTAADAAVAAAFAIAVVEPSANAIGGRNQILIRLPDGTVRGIDGTTQVPAGYDADAPPESADGYGAVGIPGVVAGLVRLHGEHGSLPLSEVLAPAIDYAERGFRLLPAEVARQSSAANTALAFEGTRAVFFPEGKPRDVGNLLIQRDLAETLRAIAREGHDGFYRGAVASKIAADMKTNGGLVTRADLAAYEAMDATIVRGSYRGFELVGMNVPAAGVVTIQGLHILENFRREDMDPEEWAAIIGQAMGLASPELFAMGTDSAAERATSKAWAAEVATRVRVPAHPHAPSGAALPPIPTDLPPTFGSTTHLSAGDASGMFISLTQTVGTYLGAKVVTPGTGVLYANTMGPYLSGTRVAGTRVRSFISPLMVLKDGKPFLILGGAGGGRIVSAVVQIVSRVVDDGMALPEALAAPRVHLGFGGADMDMETSRGIGWDEEQLAAVRALGLTVTSTERAGAFGRVHGIQIDPETGTMLGAADPDWEGSARGPRRISPTNPR